MANIIAKQYLTANGKFFEPGDEVTGLTTEQWKSLMKDDAIESDIDPAEIVEAEGEELDFDDLDDDDDDDAGGHGGADMPVEVTDVEDAEDHDSDGDEADAAEDVEDEPEVELPASVMPDVSGTGAAEAPAASDKPKRAGRGKKTDENQAG